MHLVTTIPIKEICSPSEI